MNLKKTICLMLSLPIILNFTACGPEDPRAETGKSTPSAYMEIERNMSSHNSIEALLLNTPNHISEVFSENFKVEADVHVPQVKKADILFAQYMPFDEQKLLSLFYKGKTPQRSLNSYDDIVSYEDDSSYLNINSGFIAYATQDYQYVKFPTDSFVSSSDISTGNQCFDEVYKLENLGFMTKSEAFKTVSEVFKELSIEIMEDAEIYAVDSFTMQTQQDERIQEYIDYQKKMGISPVQNPTEGYQTKDTFTPEDDFYILFFKIAQNNIPVTQKSYIIQASERFLNGSTARVSFSRKGIIQLQFNGIYQQKGVAESPSTVISVEEALQKAFEKHNVIISTDKVTVTAIDFEYVPVPYNSNYNEVKLTPAWSLTLAYERDKISKDGKKGSEPHISYRTVFINAVTGEEIR